MKTATQKTITIPVIDVELEGFLSIPENATGIIIFAHGSGSSRHSPRNNYVSEILKEAGFATLLIDLLTKVEDADYYRRFDINLISERLEQVSMWSLQNPLTENLEIGYFGASTGAAAALNSAAKMGNKIKAIVSRGGRPDLAIHPEMVQAPSLLLVGGNDVGVIELNHEAYEKLCCEKEMHIISGATHLFTEEGKLDEVAQLASEWFGKYLK